MNLFVKGALLTAVVAMAGATSAAAQNTDNDLIDVTAVVETALDVQGVQDLDFGPVFPGFGRTVAADAAGSGEFLISGGVGGGIDIAFTLPTVLTSGLNTMPVSFTAASGADRASAASRGTIASNCGISHTSISATWSASPDSNLVGYHVYRGSVANGFSRMTTAPITATSFTDLNGSSTAAYMVRAIKLENTTSGSYHNASQGVFWNAGGTDTPRLPETTDPTIALSAPAAGATVSGTSVSVSATVGDNRLFGSETSTAQ